MQNSRRLPENRRVPEKVIIIGSGPAAWAAAIYAARAALKPLVFEGAITEENRLAGTLPLGQLSLTTEVENYPGFPAGDLGGYLDSALGADQRRLMAPHNKEGVSGPELMELMRQQARNFGTRIVTEDIVDVDFSSRPFGLTASDGSVYQSHAVIVATGARANYLGLPSEEKYKNRGVSACAVCDGALPRFRNKPLAVVGGGDSAVEEADYLSKFASTVFMVHRRDRAAGVEDHVGAGTRQPENRSPLEPHPGRGLGQRQGRRDRRPPAKHRGPSPSSTQDVTGLFLAIGHTPNTAFLKGKLELTAKQYIKWTTPARTYTSVEGVFAAGDVADDYYRQAVTAAGSGCMAALDAERWLAAKGF